jgi:hypothetical protein
LRTTWWNWLFYLCICKFWKRSFFFRSLGGGVKKAILDWNEDETVSSVVSMLLKVEWSSKFSSTFPFFDSGNLNFYNLIMRNWFFFGIIIQFQALYKCCWDNWKLENIDLIWFLRYSNCVMNLRKLIIFWN